ncbi:MAG: hypothetical protein K0B06_13410 [Brevefilum sp.]|nr:hypothetical protein [Brevefilum sp.]
MVDEAERKILRMIEQGNISAEEGLRLINAMNSGQPGDAESVDQIMPSPEDVLEPEAPRISPEEQQRMKRLKRWWILPFGIGLFITTLGATWMYTGYANRGFSWGFWLAWIPFILGIFIVAVSFQTSRSVWLHVRIKQKPGETPARISISLPMPITLAKWFMSVFGNKIPGLKDQPLGDISEILETISPEEPFYIHVNDDDEEVEVFIG